MKLQLFLLLAFVAIANAQIGKLISGVTNATFNKCIRAQQIEEKVDFALEKYIVGLRRVTDSCTNGTQCVEAIYALSNQTLPRVNARITALRALMVSCLTLARVPRTAPIFKRIDTCISTITTKLVIGALEKTVDELVKAVSSCTDRLDCAQKATDVFTYALTKLEIVTGEANKGLLECIRDEL